MDHGSPSTINHSTTRVASPPHSITDPVQPQMLRSVTDTVSQKLRNNNVFTIAKRNVEGQDMLYQSMKLTNGIWVLAELKIQPGNATFQVRVMRDKV